MIFSFFCWPEFLHIWIMMIKPNQNNFCLLKKHKSLKQTNEEILLLLLSFIAYIIFVCSFVSHLIIMDFFWLVGWLVFGSCHHHHYSRFDNDNDWLIDEPTATTIKMFFFWFRCLFVWLINDDNGGGGQSANKQANKQTNIKQWSKCKHLSHIHDTNTKLKHAFSRSNRKNHFG